MTDSDQAEYPNAAAKLEAIAGKPMRTAIVVWADFFASELAVLNGKDSADRTHAHRFERAMLEAARAGHLRLRSMDAVGAPIDGKKIGAMSNDAITQRVAADTQDVRAWAREHWPELMQSRLLAEPNAAPAEQPATLAGPGTVRHSTKGKRAQTLDAEIEAAKREATNPDDAAAVYAVLQRWAEQKRLPFIEYMEGEGCKYRTPRGAELFTLDALRKRMQRAANGR